MTFARKSFSTVAQQAVWSGDSVVEEGIATTSSSEQHGGVTPSLVANASTNKSSSLTSRSKKKKRKQQSRISRLWVWSWRRVLKRHEKSRSMHKKPTVSMTSSQDEEKSLDELPDSSFSPPEDIRSHRGNIATGKPLLIRQKAQVSSRPSMAYCAWEVVVDPLGEEDAFMISPHKFTVLSIPSEVTEEEEDDNDDHDEEEAEFIHKVRALFYPALMLPFSKQQEDTKSKDSNNNKNKQEHDGEESWTDLLSEETLEAASTMSGRRQKVRSMSTNFQGIVSSLIPSEIITTTNRSGGRDRTYSDSEVILRQAAKQKTEKSSYHSTKRMIPLKTIQLEDLVPRDLPTSLSQEASFFQDDEIDQELDESLVVPQPYTRGTYAATVFAMEDDDNVENRPKMANQLSSSRDEESPTFPIPVLQRPQPKSRQIARMDSCSSLASLVVSVESRSVSRLGEYHTQVEENENRFVGQEIIWQGGLEGDDEIEDLSPKSALGAARQKAADMVVAPLSSPMMNSISAQSYYWGDSTESNSCNPAEKEKVESCRRDEDDIFAGLEDDLTEDPTDWDYLFE